MSSSDILISVVIPTYNYAHYLPRALDSVTSQMRNDIEVIVVDDGSTDNTASVLDEYIARWPVVRVLRQPNAGAGAARNHGIRVAYGEYVLLLDADDELIPLALKALRDMLVAQPGIDVVLGAHVSVHPDGREKLRAATSVPALSSPELVRHYLLEKRIVMSHSCTLFRRKLLLERPYPENLRTGEDIPVFVYLLVHGQVETLSRPIARIYKHPGSLRHSRDEEKVAMAVVDEVFASLPDQCQALRARYKAQRYLSLFRNSSLAKDWPAARRFYWLALKLSPTQALRWDYAKKALKILFKR